MKIVFLDWLTMGLDVSYTDLKEFGDLHVFQTTKPEECLARVKYVDIIITNKVILDKSLLEHCNHLKLICLSATGMNNVDLEYTKERGITVKNVADYSTDMVAQHTFAMLFYLLEHLQYYDNYVKSGQYIQSPVFTHLNRTFWELSGKRWGIIGLGNIGRKVAKLAQAFGCEVVYYSTSGNNFNTDYQKLTLYELMCTSDVVSIHAPLNKDTINLIDYEKLKSMKPTSYLINVGRGNIVNEADLVRALNENKLAGAGVDVLSVEPMKIDSSLMSISNNEKLLVTPHIAWASVEARRRLVQRIAQNIRTFLNK